MVNYFVLSEQVQQKLTVIFMKHQLPWLCAIGPILFFLPTPGPARPLKMPKTRCFCEIPPINVNRRHTMM
jgi:hypothetical protein